MAAQERSSFPVLPLDAAMGVLAGSQWEQGNAVLEAGLPRAAPGREKE